MDWHPWQGHQFGHTKERQYNDLIRSYYDTLYRQNVEVDILTVDDPRLSRYDQRNAGTRLCPGHHQMCRLMAYPRHTCAHQRSAYYREVFNYRHHTETCIQLIDSDRLSKTSRDAP